VLTVTQEQRITVEDVPGLLDPEGFEAALHAGLKQSEMLRYHFRSAAQTGLMVYRNYFDQHKPARKLAWSSEVIFNVLQQYEPEHVLLREARRESLRTFVDAEGAQRFLLRRLPAKIRPVGMVPPLAFAMYATRIKEALLLEEPFAVQERLFHLWWQRLNDDPDAAARD
jgi:ATP-dependent Lhr-like helicase